MLKTLGKPLTYRSTHALFGIAVALCVSSAMAIKPTRDTGFDHDTRRIPLNEKPLAAASKPTIPSDELGSARKWCERTLALKTAADSRVLPKDVVMYGRGGAYSCQQVLEAP